MMQIIGAMFILGSGIVLGFYKAAQYANRPKQLRQLHHVVQRLETEIVYGSTPLPNALHTIGHQVAQPVGKLFYRISEALREEQGSTLEQCWRREIEAQWSITALKNNEKQILLQLGQSLGISDKQDQMKHLHLAMRGLQMEEEAAKEEQAKYEKMWRSLGLLIGALVVILMY